MPRIDLSLPELREYRPEPPGPAGFEAFRSPSTVFAAYQCYAGPKEIAVYEFNDDEGGGPHQQARQAAWLASVLG